MTASACPIAASGTIELHFYGELSTAEAGAFTAHAATCAECRRALDDLAVIKSALAARPVVAAPASGEWSSFMTKLHEAMEHEPAVNEAPLAFSKGSAAAGALRTRPVATPQAVRHTAARRTPRTRTRRSHVIEYVAMAALLALVTISVLVAVRSRSAMLSPAPVAADQLPVPAGGVDAAFAALSEEHFERSKLVVLGLATKDPDRATAVDWTYERQLASSLLTDTRMYRLAAEDRGLRSIASVMRDLELVLLQTSLTDDTDPGSLGQIQRLIRKRDLIGKMDAVTAG